MANTYDQIAIVAHRGGSALAPENTLVAFRNALRIGVEMVECDVHLSKDGAVVVMHDPSLERTTNGSGLIADKTLAELKTLNAAAKFGDGAQVERIPTLEEVLDLVKGKARVQIEIKAGTGIEQKIVDMLHAKDMVSEVIIISFNFPSINTVKELDKNIATGALVGGLPNDKTPEEIVEHIMETTHADFFLPYYAPVDAALVKAVHARGMKIGVWTVNTSADMRRMADFGIDALTTDRPDELRRMLGR